MGEKDDQQLVFETLLSGEKPVEKVAKKVVRRKVSPKKFQTPQFAVRLTHEEGVDWRLDCLHASEDELDSGYYTHLACEALKLEVLKLLKKKDPDKQVIQLLALILTHLGAGVPEILQVDQNKNLFEGDFWSDFEACERSDFKGVNHSYLWAFYFKEFETGKILLEKEFINYPADETDILFLLDAELVIQYYPGLQIFI